MFRTRVHAHDKSILCKTLHICSNISFGRWIVASLGPSHFLANLQHRITKDVMKSGDSPERGILYINTTFMWLYGNRFSDMLLDVYVCKDISQSMIYIFFVHFVSYITECYGQMITYCTDKCDYHLGFLTNKFRLFLVLRFETTIAIIKYTNLYIKWLSQI